MPAGLRLFVGSGLEQATFSGEITNQNSGGDDTFVLEVGGGQDRVLDFSTRQDRLDVSAFFSNFQQLLGSGAIQQQQGDALLNCGGGDSVTLAGGRTSQLTADNFVF